ncbi:MAG TPA: BTAD domain-containing putative transcriptional regulator, partial [Actinophytocola sp.]|uniref:ATP-binding protein n=1 Tax=Actinophytocola sp. TaxID=1872138 RepID=UPI002DDD1A88
VASGARALASGSAARAHADLLAGLALWRGPALAEFADEPFARAEAARLAELRMRAVEHRIAADLALGHQDDLVVELEKLVAEHPLRERFWGQLMLALYRSGRQGEALLAYQTVRELMADQLGADPGPELRRLHTAMLRKEPRLESDVDSAPARTGRPRGNLPAPLTSFVGRRRELVAVHSLVRTRRLVTLTGVGGVGKSRLALEVAAASRADFPGGVWLVELAALAQPGLVPSAIAGTLGIRERPHQTFEELVAGRVGAVATLLVLDNCEHLVDEVAAVADRLLRRCSQLTILTTSRERLGIIGETVRPVPGLGVPAAGVTAPRAIGRADAVRLLVERAAAVHPGFALTETTAGLIAQICRRLDGLPLALELAAAGVPVRGVERIAAQLDDPLGLLTRGNRSALPRHQTLRAAVDWSYGLLDARQRRMFDQLAVFAGGFTVEAAEAVHAEPGAAEVLAQLVEKSLVAVDPDGRYRMLESLRAYGCERLAASGAEAAVRDRHAAHVLAMVTSARRGLRGAEHSAWLRRLAAEMGNIRAALEWTTGRGDAATAVRLAGSLHIFWERYGHYREGSRWLARALALPAPVAPTVRARALESAAGLAVLQGDLATATAATTEVAALSRAAGDPAGLARALTTGGLVDIYADDLDRAVEVLREALEVSRRADTRWPEAFALQCLACAALGRGEYAWATQLLRECGAVMESLGDRDGLFGTWMLQAIVAWRDGDAEAAVAELRRAVDGYRGLGHRWGLSFGLLLAGELAAARGQPRRAVSLLAAAEALRESIGAAPMPFAKRWIDAAVAKTRAVLGPAAVDRAWRAGHAMPPERALAEALPSL